MEVFLGSITMFGGNFAPRGWAFCDGQLLPISSNQALFSLLGTIYGGDGRTTFALPDLRGRVPMHAGNGPGLSSRPLGSKGGAERVTLTVAEMPSHNHIMNINIDAVASSGDDYLNTTPQQLTNQSPTVHFGTESITDVGGNQSHYNMMPYNCINFIIAIEGVFPSRS